MDPSISSAVTSASVTGVLGLVGVGVTHLLGRRHTRVTVSKVEAERDQAHAQADAAQAQAAQAISAAASALIAPLTTQVTALTAKVATLEAKVITLEVENTSLKTRLETHECATPAA